MRLHCRIQTVASQSTLLGTIPFNRDAAQELDHHLPRRGRSQCQDRGTWLEALIRRHRAGNRIIPAGALSLGEDSQGEIRVRFGARLVEERLEERSLGLAVADEVVLEEERDSLLQIAVGVRELGTLAQKIADEDELLPARAGGI